MINISNIIKTWSKNEHSWSVAPSGLTWIQEGSWIKCGENVEIGDYTTIGDGTIIGNYTKIGDDTTIGDYTKIGNGTKIGNYTKIGNDTNLGNDTTIGDDTIIGNYTNLGANSKVLDNSKECIDLGFYDGFRKVLCLVDVQARIASGCRDFSISEALEHWGNHKDDRKMTFFCIETAQKIALSKGWKVD